VRQDHQTGGHQEDILHDHVPKKRQRLEIPERELPQGRYCAGQGQQHLLLILLIYFAFSPHLSHGILFYLMLSCLALHQLVD